MIKTKKLAKKNWSGIYFGLTVHNISCRSRLVTKIHLPLGNYLNTVHAK